ncbi:vps51/Vps67 family (components of vesicular transport) protein [Wolffia australiana]
MTTTTAMATEIAPPMDEKAKRTRDLLASFYATEASAANRAVPVSPSGIATLDSINSSSFQPDLYMDLLIRKMNLESLLHKHVEMAAEIKNLDTDLQMLVYENYNKFISATDTIKRMKNNILGMETNMEQLLEKIVSVQSKSDGVNSSLFAKREKIEKLHRTGNFLRKIQFIYDLPGRLQKCIESEAYADAVRFFIGAKPIFEAYGVSSFQECKLSSEEKMKVVVSNLKAKLFLDTEPIEARAQAVVLLKQLNFPVESLQKKMLDNLEEFLVEFLKEPKMEGTDNANSDDIKSPESLSDSAHLNASNKVSIAGFSKTVNAYRIIFPDSERRLIELIQDWFTRRHDTIRQQTTGKLSSESLVLILRDIWSDVSIMDEVLPDAALPAICLEATRGVIELYIANSFSSLLHHVSDALSGGQTSPKKVEGQQTLRAVLDCSRKAIIQGSVDYLLDFRHFLDNGTLEIVTKMRDLIVDWVQEGFQNFFKSLNRHFFLLCGRDGSKHQLNATDGFRPEKVQTGLVLVLAQLSVFVEQIAIPRITEEIAASFSGGSLRGYEYGPAFVPGEICRLFRSASSSFLLIYITMRSQKISALLKKRFMAPNWIKHKEPREVHMFVDLLLHELHEVGVEVRQILPYGLGQRHRRTESTGSTTSSRSNPLREVNRSNTQRARSQLLESHLAKLFEQKMEIFTKIEHTEESIVSTIVKLALKSIQELVQLQTFNRSGYQQIQLDMEFLKSSFKDMVHDEAVIDFLLKEVNNAAHERCLDPVPLEPAIIDKLIQSKLAKNRIPPTL